MHISENMWYNNLRLDDDERAEMVKSFPFEEIDWVMKSMRTNIAPGPDEFPVGFYK